MKVVILAGGRGSRLAEMTDEIPKPMVRIGGKPMLYHIMSIYARFGFCDFLIAGGYKQEVIWDWLKGADLPWPAQLIDTGQDTQTGGRIKALAKHLGDRFLLTYGDGVANIDISALLTFHEKHQSFCTVTAVHPPSRFGELELEKDYVQTFAEKPVTGWVNGGYFVVDGEALDYIRGDEPWESGALARLTGGHLLTAYRHEGFWQCMDTLHDVRRLNELAKEAPWIGQISG